MLRILFVDFRLGLEYSERRRCAVSDPKKDGTVMNVKSSVPRKKRSGIRAAEQIQLMLIMLPTFVLIFIFCYIPLYGVLIAFQDYVPGAAILGAGAKWVGFRHFADFIGSRTFPRLIRNTLVLSGLNLLFGFCAPIIFALILNEVKAKRFKQIVQTASYLPYFISTVIVAGMVLSFIDTNGIINVIRKSLGLAGKAYSMDPKAFPVIYTITNIWKSFGWDSILYLSAMSSIDMNLYEAARLDGANRGQQMWNITLPAIKPTVMLLLIFAIGGVLGSNTELILLLYNPATYETADVIGTYVYRDSLLGGRFSFGTAVSLFTSVLNFALIFLANTVSRKVADYSMW